MTEDLVDHTPERTLGLAIRQIREQRGRSLDELAELADLDPLYACGIEDGVRRPSWSVVASLLAHLDCSIGEFGRAYDRLAPS